MYIKSKRCQYGVCALFDFFVMVFINVFSCDKGRRYKGSVAAVSCVDLILADLPEGHHVPRISNPPSSIPAWNIEFEDWFQTIFDFADHHLQDDGVIILFHPFRLSTKSIILGYCSTYGFAVCKEWWE